MSITTDVLADVAGLQGLAPDEMDHDAVTAALATVTRVRGWLDCLQARLARRLTDLSRENAAIFPAAAFASATNTSVRGASKAVQQASTLGEVPAVEQALSSGAVSSEHVEVLDRAIKRLKPELRNRLTRQDRRLAEIAARSTPEAFERVLKREVHAIDSGEATDRLDWQRRQNRLRTWTDHVTGMVCGRFELDPETGVRFLGRLDNLTDALFHASLPAYCPSEGEAKQGFLRALALTNALLGASAAPAAANPDARTDPSDDPDRPGGRESIERIGTRSDIMIVIDWQSLVDGYHSGGRVDSGFGVDLPVESYRRWLCTHNLIPVVLNSDGVAMELGRTRRTASPGQRRALAAMYRTCPVPGCTVSSRHCEPHHIRWWGRHFGLTDLDNLIPLCSKHHHAVHEGGWTISLDSRRCLTIVDKDGSVQTTGPPIEQWRE